MRRESHRRRGAYRASTGGWGHRAVYIGAIVAAVAMVSGFGAALLPYGPLGLGVPSRQISGSSTGVPPTGVYFGNATELFASGLNLNVSGTGAWAWTTAGNFTGPCNGSGVFQSGVYNLTNYSNLANINSTAPVDLVCLNSVYGGNVTATWYNSTFMSNSYDPITWVPNGSTYNNGVENISSCNEWTPAGASSSGTIWNATHVENLTTFTPCNTYYEMNNNTTYVTSFVGSQAVYNGSTGEGPWYEWAYNESGYLPGDVLYEVPVLFTPMSVNGTYEISIAIGGVTPVVQTFYFNDSLYGGTTNVTVEFVFDMTAAWLMDLSFNMDGMPATTPMIYGAIGTVSTIVTECAPTGCPV